MLSFSCVTKSWMLFSGRANTQLYILNHAVVLSSRMGTKRMRTGADIAPRFLMPFYQTSIRELTAFVVG